MLKKLQQKRRKKRSEQLRKELIRLRYSGLLCQYQDFALSRTAQGVAPSQDTPPVVVSLTTFDKRINDVYLTIESLFQQSHKADKIVLWVSKEDFSSEDLPAMLKLQMKRGLEVEFCEKDLGPYTKFFYALQRYPDSLVLTVDDDILYPPDMIDQLVRAYRKAPDVIHCHRAHKMTLGANGRILSYKQWARFTQDSQPSLHVFPTGVGGVLYFPGCFDDEILNQDAFTRFAPNADDVWLKAMSLKKGTYCRKLDDSRDWELRFVVIEGSQAVALKRRNKQKSGGNDEQIEAVFDHYNLTELLR